LRLLPGAERMPKIKIIQGLRLLPRHRDYSAHSFAQQRMRRTSQLVGLDFSTGRSISPLPVNGQCRKGSIDFHDVSRASTDARIELAQREFTLRVREAPLASLI